MKDKSTVELRGRLDHINGQMAKVLAEAKTDAGGYDFSKVTTLDGSDTAAKVEQFQTLNTEATEIGKELDDRRGLDDMGQEIAERRKPQRLPFPSGGKAQTQESKTLGERFAGTESCHAVSPGQMGPEMILDDVDVKSALFETGSGWAPPSVRSNVVEPFAVRPLVIANLLRTINVSLPTFSYMEQTTFTNSAAPVAEGASKPELALGLTERTETIRKIAGYLPVTDEQLEDVPAARDFIDTQLGYMIRQVLEDEIISGSGSGQHLVGINHSARSGIQQQAKSSDDTTDAVYKAMTLIRVNALAEPNAVVFHPSDWQDVRLLRTTDGLYIWGHPSEVGPERIWGIDVVQSTGASEGTALVGDWNRAALLTRMGLTMKVGYVNDDLIKNRQTIVAELRAAVAVFRPAAFCEVTGV